MKIRENFRTIRYGDFLSNKSQVKILLGRREAPYKTSIENSVLLSIDNNWKLSIIEFPPNIYLQYFQ